MPEGDSTRTKCCDVVRCWLVRVGTSWKMLTTRARQGLFPFTPASFACLVLVPKKGAALLASSTNIRIPNV